MIKFGWLVVLVFLLLGELAAQTSKTIQIEAKKTPLNQVLLDLKEAYGLQFAFDNDLLSTYTVSVNRTFQSEDEALSFLIKNLPLKVERSGEMYLIIPVSDEPNETYAIQISGQVLEAFSYEPLPFSYIIINRKSVQTDQQGNFNFLASADTSLNLRISHLGYFMYDTVVSQTMHKQFFLNPHIERIQEVAVTSNLIEKSTLIGHSAGKMKVNHQIAPVLPGFGDNSVFNLLRLMPGIMAAGEQSNDLLIWGAYESHSKIQFDGFTLFGLKNFNDNISVVNPLMVKNIEVMKGGYEARYGDRVGGIVDIAGKDGSLQKPGFEFTINSTTINGLLQVPLSEKSSIMAAYRQSYYELYEPTNLTLFRRKEPRNGGGLAVDYEVIPDFQFRDGNLKYTYKGTKGGRLALSLYGGGDAFSYVMEGSDNIRDITRTEEENNKQFGTSMQYSRPWDNGSSTGFTVAYSAFAQNSFEQNKVKNRTNSVSHINKQVKSDNQVDEIAIHAEHAFHFNEGHKLLLGVGVINNRVELSRIANAEQVLDIDSDSPRLTAYLQDELPIGKTLDLNAGVRMVYTGELEEFYFEPRVAASYEPLEGLKINAAWGLYNQFISKTSFVDTTDNFAYFWINSDGDEIPVLSAQHVVAGVSFKQKGFTLSTEGYYKTSEGLNRYFRGNKTIGDGFYEGHSRAYGLDLFIKQEYKKQMLWVSYSISQTEEHFPFYLRDYYKPAPHHQKHEVKVAGIFNYKSFYLSGNYVYGSGFERFNVETEDGTMLNQPYSRLDAALIYKFKPGKVKAEVGISVLNVLDTDNIKYSNIGLTTVDEISLVGTYADAVSFTPALFFNIKF